MQLNVSKIFFLLAISILLIGQAHAQSSLGIGASEPKVNVDGPFANILSVINQYQQQFYRALTGALKEMREDPGKLWLLIGMSFAYGIFHAAGPGHGKAIISSYMIANEVELKRGITLSFIAAFMQGVMAFIVVGAVYLLLRGSSISMPHATFALELASYALIIIIGLWLLWRKIKSFRNIGHNSNHHHHSHDHDHAHHHHDHDHSGDGAVCDQCGHAHMPDPKELSGNFSLRQAWTAVLAVGIRPCSGAIIVLSFALLNQLYLGGILSVFAMAIGTAITVSILATLAVTAKNTMVGFTKSESSALRVGSIIEVIGAILVLLLGVVLLSAALSGV